MGYGMFKCGGFMPVFGNPERAVVAARVKVPRLRSKPSIARAADTLFNTHREDLSAQLIWSVL